MKAILLLVSVLMTCSLTGSKLPTPSATDGRPNTADLTAFVTGFQVAVQETSESGDSQNLAVFLKELRVPDSPNWFAATFGVENGKLLAPLYAETLVNEEQHVARFFAHPTEEESSLRYVGLSAFKEGRLRAVLLPQEGLDDVEYRQRFESGILKSTVRAADFYRMEFVWTPLRTEEVRSIGYATFIDGKYRLVSDTVLHLLPAAAPIRIHLRGAEMAAKLVNKVNPAYPEQAKKQGITGTVRLRAVIGIDGKVKHLDVQSGDPLLASTALEAVRNWRYESTVFKGDKVEVDAPIDVIFSINDKPPSKANAAVPR